MCTAFTALQLAGIVKIVFFYHRLTVAKHPGKSFTVLNYRHGHKYHFQYIHRIKTIVISGLL